LILLSNSTLPIQTIFPENKQSNEPSFLYYNTRFFSVKNAKECITAATNDEVEEMEVFVSPDPCGCVRGRAFKNAYKGTRCKRCGSAVRKSGISCKCNGCGNENGVRQIITIEKR
jgi:hypothetical protein